MRQKRFFFTFWIIIYNSFILLTGAEPQPYVTCALGGQLGNQLFEVAATLAHAWDNQAQPIFPELNRTDYNIPINYDRVFFRLDASPLPRPILNVFQQSVPFLKVDISYHPDQRLVGLFQSWQYFHHHRQKILETFAPHPEELNYLKSKHADLINHPLTVGIHVRTFNKAWNGIIPFVGLNYYERAINLFPPNALFVVFSDRIHWCKHHFQKINRPMVFIEDQDHVSDLFLMSMLHHNIIGNSSFSWWAAYLNQNPDKIVVAPSYFVNPAICNNYGGQPNSNMPDWIVLDINPNPAYPNDMLDYDTYSKSIDTQ